MSIVSGIMTTGKFIKGSEFTEPMTVKFVSVTKVTANNPKFGDDAGMTNRYILEVEGEQRTFDNTSNRLMGAVDAAGIETGDMAIVKRSGSGVDTYWEVSKLGADTGPF